MFRTIQGRVSPNNVSFVFLRRLESAPTADSPRRTPSSAANGIATSMVNSARRPTSHESAGDLDHQPAHRNDAAEYFDALDIADLFSERFHGRRPSSRTRTDLGI